ncbi:HNH endonuclease [Pseudomonas sp. TWP3-2]|uniref:HNH endonuclease n=1 Tax=Pseudomonas sp. TWP3-2 TaxID=2804574 RepID=UPI003CEBB54E
MQYFSHVQAIDDLKTLKSLTLGYAFLNGTYNAIHDAYSDYLKSFGSPHLKAIGLSKDQKTCLHAAYEGGAKKYGLDWIPKVRDVLIGSCPMCGNSAVGTVEHYLPKTPFPEFSVFSWNLVPSCNSCNQKRGSKHANGVRHKLLHPIFDKDIFTRLKLVTNFDVSGAVTEFELGFNELDFDSDEQSRIQAHIMICIDRRAFKLATNVQISTMAARVARKKEAVWKAVIEEELDIMHAANLGCGWGASCLRGLLEVNQTQRSAILIPKLL